MLGECANPECHTPFRHLHDGKLFAVQLPANSISAVGSRKLPNGKVEFVWLCRPCSERLTVQVNSPGQIKIVAKGEQVSGSSARQTVSSA